MALVSSALTVQMGSDEVCPAAANWNAEYTVNEPESLFVVANP